MVAVQIWKGDNLTYTLKYVLYGELGLEAQLLLNGLLVFYETLHICSTLPADVNEGIWLLSTIKKGR
jgi:hypothetical protein